MFYIFLKILIFSDFFYTDIKYGLQYLNQSKARVCKFNKLEIFVDKV